MLESSHQSHSQKISSMESDTSQQRADLIDTKKKVATNKELFSEVNSKLTMLKYNHQLLSQQISSLQTDTSQQNTKLTDTKGKVATNERQISEAIDDIRSLQADYSQARNDLTKLEEKVTILGSFHSGADFVSLSIVSTFLLPFLVMFLQTA